MNQFSIKVMTALLLVCSNLFFSCKNSITDSKSQMVVVDSCILSCAAKEKLCWDEYDRCKGQAAVEEQAALNTCSHLPPANQWECKSKALAEYRSKVEKCEGNLRECLARLKNCVSLCKNRLVKEPDTQ